MRPQEFAPMQSPAVAPHTCTHAHRLNIVRALPFFVGLPESTLLEVNAAFTTRAIEPGQIIYMAGDAAASLFVAAVGTVKIVRHTLRGKDVLIDILGPGALFGSLAILGDVSYAETAEAKTAGCLLTIDAQAFLSLLQRFPTAAVATLGVVAARLQEAHEAIRQVTALSAEQRIATELLRLAAYYGERTPDGLRIAIPLARQEIADKVGATVETASRVLSRYEREGIVHSGRLWIEVLDLDLLADLAMERG
jgi:CRP/FNR family transcriptional regulator, nitrogen oxide reductase regulator